jgi:2-polyprenyl-3-methyl-5-hydroxy-6-metoxy-1,4-benzoquinol methylase
LWKRYWLDAIKRGELVKATVSKFASAADRAKVLDVGCGDGGTAIAFIKSGNEVYAIDVDYEIIKRAKARAEEEKVKVNFLVADGLRSPFMHSFFDIIICNDVIEHVLKPPKLTMEAHRTLKSGGIIYLSAPNKISPYQIIHDDHYGLFGISLMPRRIAKWYVTKIRKATREYNVYSSFTYWSLLRILSFYFEVTNYTRIKYLNKYSTYSRCGILLMKLLSKFLIPILAPEFIFICKKTDRRRNSARATRARM